MLNHNVNYIQLESAQLAAFQAESRESAPRQSRRGRMVAALLIAAVALGIVVLTLLSLNSPEQEIYDEEWANGRVVVFTEEGVQREREYLDEGGLTLRREVYDADGIMTGYSEYTYTHDDAGRTIRTEYRYDADGNLLSEIQSRG